MPALENQRHEKFAQGLAQGRPASEAYVEAGFTRNDGNASRLKGNEKVAARVAELKERAAVSVSISREWVIERLVENANRAMQAAQAADGGDYKYEGSVANRALELLGKELGMFVERTENVNYNYQASDHALSEDEWASQVATSH